MPSHELVSNAVLERTSNSHPRFITLPASVVADWNIFAGTLVEGSMNGFNLGQMTVRPSGDGWMIEVPSSLCAKAQVNTGDAVELRLRLAAVVMPIELQMLLDTDPLAQAKWVTLTENERRKLRDHVTVARLPDTRAQRARDGLEVGPLKPSYAVKPAVA